MSKKSAVGRSRSSRSVNKADWRRFDALTDADIAAAVSSDPDAAPTIKPSWIKKAKLVAPPDKETRLKTGHR
jgi:hypothetical protein